MRFGVNLMPQLWVDDTLVTGAALMRRRQRLLERMAETGIDHVMVGDHVTFHGGVGNDGLTDAAVVLAQHDTLAAYLGVYLLGLRHPVTVARQIATMAQFAPGRLTLGVGLAGDDRREVAACGVDPATRGRRMNEALFLLRRLLAGEEVAHSGEFFDLSGVRVRPAPDPPVPLIVGGRSEAALRRAGRFGDGWLGIWTSARRCRQAIAAVEAHGADAGRSHVAWAHGMTFWCGFGGDRAEAVRHVAPGMEALYRTPWDSFERYIPHGTPAEVAEFVAGYVDAGCTTLNFIAFAGSEEAAVDAVAEVRRILGY